MRATGAVFWSAGSGRGSPGYVLSSGDALLRLYRATGDVTLLELLRDTVHNLAQYLPDTDERKPASGDDATCSRADPGRWLAPGDSVVPADGVFDAIGLLSYTEVPSVYVRPDTGFVFVFDHVTARIKERGRGRLVARDLQPDARRGDGPHPGGDGRGRRRTASARGRPGCAGRGRSRGRLGSGDRAAF